MCEEGMRLTNIGPEGSYYCDLAPSSTQRHSPLLIMCECVCVCVCGRVRSCVYVCVCMRILYVLYVRVHSPLVEHLRYLQWQPQADHGGDLGVDSSLPDLWTNQWENTSYSLRCACGWRQSGHHQVHQEALSRSTALDVDTGPRSSVRRRRDQFHHQVGNSACVRDAVRTYLVWAYLIGPPRCQGEVMLTGFSRAHTHPLATHPPI
jgi:hypothetical protein